MSRILDEYGTPWEVEAGDPARAHINYLRAKGYEYVVLPRLTLTTGAVCGIMKEPHTLDDVRLLDCVAVLYEQQAKTRKKAN